MTIWPLICFSILNISMAKTGFIVIAFLMVLFFTSCSVITGIFKAGVWVGVLAVLAVIGLIVYFIARGRKK